MSIITKTKREFIQRCFRQETISGPVLEVGSGRDKFNRNLFAKRYKFVATNIYPQNVVDRICSVTCLPFRNNSFGCIICEHVLEHVDNPAKAIAEISRVLKPKGLLLLIVPFSWSIHEKPYDLWRFSEEGVRALLANKFQDAHFEFIGKADSPRLICVTARKPQRSEKKKYPKVSVIIPTYNRAHMVTRAIESVLGQTYQDWELLVVSDGSTDNTKEVVTRYPDPRIRFFEKKNGGPASARNVGLRHARGEYIAYCDDDDMFFSHHLEVLANYLDRHPEIDMVRGFALTFSKRRGYLKLGFLWGIIHRHRNLPKKIYFDEKLLAGEDSEFILRFSDYYRIGILDFIVTNYLIHDKHYRRAIKKDLSKFDDKRYVKRIRLVCAGGCLKRWQYIAIGHFLIKLGSVEGFLKLAHFFQKQFNCEESLYMLGIAYYRKNRFPHAKKTLLMALRKRSNNQAKTIISRHMLKEYIYGLLAWLSAQYLPSLGSALNYAQTGLKVCPESILLALEVFHAYLNAEQKSAALEVARVSTRPYLKSYYRMVINLLSNNSEALEEKFLAIIRKLPTWMHYRAYHTLSRFCKKQKSDDVAAHYLLISRASSVETFMRPLTQYLFLKWTHSESFNKILERFFLVDSSSDEPIILSPKRGFGRLKI